MLLHEITCFLSPPDIPYDVHLMWGQSLDFITEWDSTKEREREREREREIQICDCYAMTMSHDKYTIQHEFTLIALLNHAKNMLLYTVIHNNAYKC